MLRARALAARILLLAFTGALLLVSARELEAYRCLARLQSWGEEWQVQIEMGRIANAVSPECPGNDGKLVLGRWLFGWGRNND